MIEEMWRKIYIWYYNSQYNVHMLKKIVRTTISEMYKKKKQQKLKRTYLADALLLFKTKYEDNYRFILDFKEWFDYIETKAEINEYNGLLYIPHNKQLEGVVLKWIEKIEE